MGIKQKFREINFISIKESLLSSPFICKTVDFTEFLLENSDVYKSFVIFTHSVDIAGILSHAFFVKSIDKLDRKNSCIRFSIKNGEILTQFEKKNREISSLGSYMVRKNDGLTDFFGYKCYTKYIVF